MRNDSSRVENAQSEDTSEIELSICIVNYNVSDKVEELLTTVESGTQGVACEILVVDNASMDGILDVVAKHQSVQLIRNTENRYFTAADNQNLARAKGRFVVSLNPDTVPQPGALTSLMRYLEAHPEVGAVSPQFAFPDGRIQACLGHFPSLSFGVLESAGLNLAMPWNRVNRAMWPEGLDYDPDREQDGEVLYGACIMVRCEVLATVGLKDEALVHGWDEYDWCRRIAQAGWKLRYVPSAVVIHHQGASRSYQAEGTLAKYHWDGLFYLYRKYYGWGVYLLLRCLYATRSLWTSRPVIRLLCKVLKAKGKTR
jgi:GT2 family glycosyltransferase